MDAFLQLASSVFVFWLLYEIGNNLVSTVMLFLGLPGGKDMLYFCPV